MTSIFTDHSDLRTLSQIAKENAFRPLTARFGLGQQFWATPARESTSPLRETLEIALVARQLVNWIQLDLARFPHEFDIEYFDEQAQDWQPIVDTTGSVVSRVIHKSMPSIIPPSTSVVGPKHPQHAFMNHWETMLVEVRPTHLQRLRILLRRIHSAAAPVDSFGKKVDYSLAIRNLAMGYRVAGTEDVPRTLPGASATYYEPFAQADDVISSQVSFAFRQLDAMDTLGEGENDIIWRSEPQADPNCVVCVYADLRGPDGQAQTIDRIFLDPINNGAHITLYFAHDLPDAEFLSPNDPLPESYPDATSGMLVDDTGMHFGTSPSTDSIILSNRSIGWNPSTPWWIGMVVVPRFDPVDVTTNRPVLQSDICTLYFTNNGMQLRTAHNDHVDMVADYQRGNPMRIVMGYDGTQYFLTVTNAFSQYLASTDSTNVFDPAGIDSIAIGSDLARTIFTDVDLQSLVIKEELLVDRGVAFAADPNAYTHVYEYARDEPDTSRRGALLRFNPLNARSSIYPWGIFAGVPSRYESMIWTPITRDYTMQRGWLELPPTKAKFWKLEFTHLQAQFSDIYQPIAQTVKRFPPVVLAEYRARLESATTPSEPGLTNQEELSAFSAYSDNPNAVSTGGTGLGYTNTEVYTAEDAATATRLYEVHGENWAYQQWQGEQTAPRFIQTGEHVYLKEEITRTAKIGYVVGLRRLNFARLNYSTKYDTPQYEEMFYDTVNLVSNSWIFDEDKQAITSGGSNLVKAVSKSFVSNRDVRGVQFAAQQSPAREIMDDSEFDDPLHTNWTASGDAVLGDIIESPSFDHLLPVKRLRRSGTWGDIEGNFPLWGDFVPAAATYGSLSEKIGQTPSGSDGVQSVLIPQPKGGYLYGATRVISNTDLREPLWLQLYDPVSERVLAEQSRIVRKGQINEWFTTYRVGSVGKVHTKGVTWGDLDGRSQAHAQSFLDTFDRADSTTLGRLNSGQSWTVEHDLNTQSLHIAGNEAVVTAAYPVQSSAIDVGTPWGSLTVTLDAAYTPLSHLNSAVVPLIKLGGYWFLNDNRIVDSNTGKEKLYDASITGGDVLRFEFKPTSFLTPTENPGSIPAEIRSWAIVLYVNNTYVGSIITSRGISSVRALSGAVGSAFVDFAWVPRTDVGLAPPLRYQEFPGPTEIANLYVDPSSSVGTLIAKDGREYQLSPSDTYNFYSGGATYGGNAHGIVGLASPASVIFEATSVEGVLSGYANVTLSGTDPTTWKLLLLDDITTSRLYVTADGNLVRTTQATGDVALASNVWNLPSGTYLAEDYSVAMMSTSKVPAAIKTAYSIPDTNLQTIVFMRGDTVTMAYSDNDLFASNYRGALALNGSTIQGLAWTPMLGVVNPIGTGGRTWGEIDGHGTKTYADVLAMFDVVLGADPVQVRLIQKGTTTDEWLVDALTIFFDPIVWEFSNNAGVDWVGASEIRNNPHAAALFLPKDKTVVANQLAYRVSSYAPAAWVSHLVLRPWYRGFMSYVPVKPAQPHGPNMNPRDHYAPVTEDPNWMVWHEPIPREWWYVFRQLLPNIAPPRSKLPMVSERISINA